MKNRTIKQKTVEKIDSDKILADIEIARANLYLFRNSEEKDIWEELLDNAQKSVHEKPEYSIRLVNRVNEVVSKLWDRIFKWKEFQKRIMKYFVSIIIGELTVISVYYYFIDIVEYGFYSSMLFGLLGGTLGVILNLGKDLKVGESNQLGMLKLILRPFIGVISSLILFNLIQLNIINISIS
ncbi:MAG: hypothetical protein HYT27_03670, partial [Parcubacteria group bacterium]|nr:hypothetical protein [Parcubacteria group bacterium]